MSLQKSSDDGEPSGTAGIPMLEVLKKRDLHNVVAVVTRYFGGVKLGSGGLVRTYGKSVSQAIDAAGLCKKSLVYDCSFDEEPEAAGKIINMLYSQTLFSIKDIVYGEKVTIIIRIAEKNLAETKVVLQELFSREMEFTACEEKLIEIPV